MTTVKYFNEGLNEEIEQDVFMYLKDILDGSDYERGELETINATSSNIIKAFANLIVILKDKDILNNEDILKITDGIW